MGTVADESVRLLHALGAAVPPEGMGDRFDARRGRRSASSGSPSAERPGCACGSGMAPECQICPVCLGLRMLRDKHPDVILALADLVADVASSLRAFGEDQRDDPGNRPR